jgi:hypothetical protein
VVVVDEDGKTKTKERKKAGGEGWDGIGCDYLD